MRKEISHLSSVDGALVGFTIAELKSMHLTVEQALEDMDEGSVPAINLVGLSDQLAHAIRAFEGLTADKVTE